MCLIKQRVNTRNCRCRFKKKWSDGIESDGRVEEHLRCLRLMSNETLQGGGQCGFKKFGVRFSLLLSHTVYQGTVKGFALHDIETD